ncbi:hypothetical protein Mpal_1111 [Methanosphaerula palustris E1-9c]|uniref:Uncharacterized protein n=1 Tax=Methanosphaerula palustris (strain ATCC BAA-1556 / DSM 19958 / E1-9c) TaxID=521011 RepID=B8GH51_METPE|nr:hypothetical protein Mpal_1111 [Methanosphaerula palustris E1-9c]
MAGQESADIPEKLMRSRKIVTSPSTIPTGRTILMKKLAT